MSNDQSEQLFTREQVEQIIEEMSRKLNLARSSEGPTNLPNEILEELENSSSINLQKNIKEFFKNLPKYEGSEWTSKNLKGKLWMPSKVQTQYTRELIDSSSQEEQQQAFTKNANNSWNQEEVKNNSFTLWKASDNSQFTHTPRVRPPKVKLGQWRSRRSGSPIASNTWKKNLVTRP
ncbi:uncharacterized protein RHIMIDRAFT_246457 [Rhizopus microsporus ATCC 52813]|uniref:Uncharacterized protein n=1 Tax=Rhizopus microsporus ATCC 52813 TaxID=1340429 RepID=A0A2G4SK78_RHIZD|nr:uncharacterized protein RHIMIDRAFT_246457 [Rhizopus microsporus ATCC 52813]PHZ09174.1 hypothetical protein RHIMIDRAFT_246457 [Rhizopus microsporus ATCC 52813]